MTFTQRIMLWYKNHQRDLPWRNISDPYKTWLSEIILQQTRISQGTKYYYRFIEMFPTIEALAEASEDSVLSLWQGLGYYSRARNLHATAKTIVKEYNGDFPADFHKLLKLKGIGHYTSAAIASMAFGLPHAAVDGNVARVLARFFGIEEPIDHPGTKKSLQEIAQSLLDRNDPGGYNQAMMDFGSLICKPSAPLCQQCPLNRDCKAFVMNKTDIIPRKSKKTKVKPRFFHFFLLTPSDPFPELLFIEKRKGNDIWKNLYQLPLIETIDNDSTNDIINHHPLKVLTKEEWVLLHKIQPMQFTHVLSHQKIYASFYYLTVKEAAVQELKTHYQLIGFDQFKELGKPALISNYLKLIEKELE